MNLREFLSEKLDVRPHEVRGLFLSFLGAFLTVATLVLARSLREALYLTSFDVKTLPYVMAATAILAVPAVEIFSRFLERHQPRRVLRGLLLLQMGGIGLLSPWLDSSRVAVVLFYLWTALGALVLTTGYWIVTSELYPLRSAKRLFGIISSGGSLGALVFGMSLGWLTQVFAVPSLALLLIVLLSLSFLLMDRLTPIAAEPKPEPESDFRPSRRSGLRSLWENPHLRFLGLIVMAATMATTLLDYQFKETLRSEVPGREDLASALGAFYGWTGAVSLVIQLLIGGRFLKRMGIGWTLSVLPILLFIGSCCFLIVPTMLVITAVRGTDLCLRKSLHRSVLEVLFVPLAPELRRRTKAFIDSVLDSISEGVGAGIVLLWVTWASLPSVYLSVFVLVMTSFFLLLNFGMHFQYLQTLVTRLTEQKISLPQPCTGPLLDGEVVTKSMESLEIPPDFLDSVKQASENEFSDSDGGSRLLEKIGSDDDTVVLATLRASYGWRDEHVPALVRLLGRDSVCGEVSSVLARYHSVSLAHLIRTLQDKQEDHVIRRRVPRILALLPDAHAGRALMDALRADRFEIRYRAGLALWCRRDRGLEFVSRYWKDQIWTSVRYELSQDRAIWELEHLLDAFEDDGDAVIRQNVTGRGALGLAHIFRILALVLDAEPVLIAFRGIQDETERLNSISLEYLEHVLPPDIRKKLWPFIGDLSEYERRKRSRSSDEVLSELMDNRSTLIFSESDSARLRRVLGLDTA